MREVQKEYAGDSGPSWILDLDGPDGNVYNLWGILEQFFGLYGWEGDPIEESKNGGHYARSGGKLLMRGTKVCLIIVCTTCHHHLRVWSSECMARRSTQYLIIKMLWRTDNAG